MMQKKSSASKQEFLNNTYKCQDTVKYQHTDFFNLKSTAK